MLEAGEDPLYIARRSCGSRQKTSACRSTGIVVAVAAKDATPSSACPRATRRWPAAFTLPRLRRQCSLNGVRSGSRRRAHTSGDPVPCTCGTRHQTDEALDYGKGYQYAHNERDAVADMTASRVACRPKVLPADERGFEKEISSARRWERSKTNERREGLMKPCSLSAATAVTCPAARKPRKRSSWRPRSPSKTRAASHRRSRSDRLCRGSVRASRADSAGAGAAADHHRPMYVSSRFRSRIRPGGRSHGARFPHTARRWIDA